MENKTSIPENYQDNLLIVNELKKVNQKLNDNLINNNSKNLSLFFKILQYNLIFLPIVITIGLIFNVFYTLKMYELLTSLDSNIYTELNKTKQYEYETISPSDSIFDQTMNEYGKSGWEAIQCRRATSSYSSYASYECIMIREK